jgi:ketosteroid isomerase-like protein
VWESVVPPAVTREWVQGYFEACISRDPARIAAYLDDDVRWSVTGPIDLLPFCGERRGKTDVLDNIVRVGPAVLRVKAMEIDEILVDGDRAATFMRLIAVHGETDRVVSYRCAQLLRFRDNKLVEFRALIDSFDAAEQMLGHPFDETLPRALRANLFAV